jgi:hypothetical protein
MAVGVVWRAGARRSLALATLAGFAVVAASLVIVRPQFGVAVGAALWLVGHRRLPRAERLVLAAAVLVPPILFGPAIASASAVRAWDPAPWSARLHFWCRATGAWLGRAQPVLALGLFGLLLHRHDRGSAGQSPSRWGYAGTLLLLSSAGAVAAGLVPGLDVEFRAPAAAAAVVAAAIALAAPPKGGPLLLTSACVVAAVAAAALGSRAPRELEPTSDVARLARAIGPGCRAFVWGTPFDTELYVRARAVPAAPQVLTFMIEGVGAPVEGKGLRGYAPTATLDGLADQLCRQPPEVVVLSDEVPPIEERPRFAELLRTRYRLVEAAARKRVYRLDSAAPSVQDATSMHRATSPR